MTKLDTTRIAERFAQLPAEQRRAVYDKIRAQGMRMGQFPILPRPASDEDVHALSPAQARQWFLWQLDPASTAYHISGALSLRGELDHGAVGDSFAALVARHESLRTVFRDDGEGLAEQVILAEGEVDLRHVDVRRAPAGERQAGTDEAIGEIVEIPFDLADGPLLRVGLIQRDDDDHLLVVVMHHIVADGASVQIIMDEFATLYRARIEAGAPQLPALAIQYADYTLWQRHWLDAGEQERQLQYWQAELGGEQPVLQLPTDRPRQASGEYRAARHRIELPAALAADLRRRAQDRGATLFMALLAGFQALLHRYSGLSDIRVGVPIANRHRVEVGGVVGLFVNTQVLRNPLQGRLALGEVLDQARQASLGAQEHQDLPFERLVEALQPERSLSHSPLFQVMFNHQRQDARSLERLSGLSVERYALGERRAQFELSLHTVEEADGTVQVSFVYAAELFDAATIERLAGHYQALLQALATAPDQALSEVALMGSDERCQLDRFSRNPQRHAGAEPVHRTIERRVARCPEATALVCGERTLSYAELNARANRLAHHLIALGVTPEIRVGLAVERSVEMVVGLLGILKAGGAFVPLDPAYPRERLRHMIEDAGLALLLTQHALRETLPLDDAQTVIELDRLALPQRPDNDPEVALHGEHLAYVIYTSGSTGKPKGAANRHAALANRLAWMQDAYGLARHDAVLQKTPFSFDVSVWEFFWPLMQGARLVMAAPGAHRDPARLVETIRTHAITTLHFVPSMLQAFLAHDGIEACTSLTRLVCSGEALPAELQGQVFARLPDVALYNLYGPTEAAIDVTHWTCRDDGRSPVAIGRPIADTQTWVLDADLNPVPVGVAGELYLGGVGLARGYLQRRGLTAERFVADPFDAAGGRLYRTGDRVRWRADGQLEYLGRLDHQVKIRGLRIELGEIDAQLLADPSVREAVTVAQPGPGGDRLVAYVVPHDGVGLDGAELSERLGRSLPDYMVPGVVVTLAALPLSPNGKIDRKALPAPELAGEAEYVAPEGATEEALAEIWSEVLDVARVGRHDNFFELGGDSILGLQIVARARRAELKISPQQLFEHQTLARLAIAAEPLSASSRAPDGEIASLSFSSTLEQARRDGLPVPRDNLADLYPLSPMQQGMLFHSLYDDAGHAYLNQLRVDIDGLDSTRFVAAWRAALARHDILRTGFLNQGDAPLQWVAREVELPLVEVDWRARDDQAAALDDLARDEHRPLDLGAPPLMRLALVCTGERRHHLIWTCHHLLLDGWSKSQLLGEVLRHYDGQSLPPVTAHYRDYIAWLQDRDSGEAFWREQVARVEEPTRLAAALPRPAAPAAGHGEVTLALDAAESERLASFARRQRVTVNTLVQGAWALVLSRYTGQRTVSFGATVAGRPGELAGAERMLGLFINTLPVVTSPQPHLGVGDWLRALQRHNLEAREYEHTPLFEIQRWADHGGQGLFDSLLVFENYPVDSALAEASPGGVTFGSVDNHEATNYSMTVAVHQGKTLRLGFHFVRAELDRDGVEWLARHCQGALMQLIASAERPLADVDLLDAEEHRRLAPWSDHARCFDDAEPIHRLIARQATTRPDAVAVVASGERLSFAEFEARANRLAHWLRRWGVEADVRVGVALERGADMLVALYAVLKAGGAYVPLDPDYPSERLHFMQEDAGIRLLLSHGAAQARVPCVESIERIDLDRLDVSRESAEPPAVAVHPAQLAYLIYTSGSTGRPKAVAVAHGALSMHCQTIAARYELTPDDREFHFLSISFDGAHERWLSPLSQGARVVLRDQQLWSAERTYDCLRDEGITVAAFPPSYLRQLADWADHRGAPPGVKTYCFAGEAFDRDMLRHAVATLQPEWVINGYGPTETVVTPTLWRVAAGQADFTSAYAPIGERVGERRAYVLDPDLNRVAPGMVGELYLGDGLARGYLGRPATTAERFVPNPFRDDGARLYRTGDRVRLNADDQLEYLGRVDQQIKLRGFRIEIGEVEAALAACEGVDEALAQVCETALGQRLVGYVTGAEAEGQAIRRVLKGRLPEYMVPAEVMVLSALPRLPNGKVDRRALPVPEMAGAADYVAPEGATEMALAAVWGEVLGVARVGRHDNFFELGGDSIISLQIVSRLQCDGWRITPRQLFERQTVVELAAVAEPVEAESEVRTRQAEGDVPLLPIQAEFFAQSMPVRHHWNQAVLLQCREALDIAALREVLAAVGDHHDSLRLRYRQDAEGRWRQSYAAVTPAQWRELLWVREARDQAQLEALCDAAQRSLDLDEGPLLRVLAIDMADGSRRLLLVAHHLVVDGVSWRILLEDLQRAYRQALAGEAIALPAKSSSYLDWARTLATYADEHADELVHWRALSGVPTTLPCDDPRGANAAADQTRLEVRLDAVRTEALLKSAPAAYRTQVNDLLLTALGQALCDWTGHPRILVDLEGHGREDLDAGIDLSRAVGWFTSLFPVALEGGGEPGETLKRTKEMLRGIPHKGLGYGIFRHLGSDAQRQALDELPRAQVVFNYLGQVEAGVDADTDWSLARERPGTAVDEAAPQQHELAINGQVRDGRLTLEVRFSASRYRHDRVAAFVTRFQEALETLVEHCQHGARGVTPSDFPLATLGQARLDALPMPLDNLADLYPLSPMQQGMLFHSLYDEAGRAYLIQLRVDIDGLDAARFQAAWRAVLARHDILRSGFFDHEAPPLQWVAREVELPLVEADWRQRDDQAAALDALARDEHRPLDLGAPPLMRLALVRTGERHHHLIWTCHHLLLDGWSKSQLLGEVLRHYAGRSLPPVTAHYRDYIAWLQGRDSGEAFWREQVARVEEPTRLAAALPRPVAPAAGHGEVTLTLDAAETAALSRVARERRVTLNTLVQAAWALVLSRYTGQRTVSFGATVAGRPGDLAGAERMLGLFINTLPVIVDVEPGHAVGDLLRQVQAINLAVREHEHTPLSDIQRWAGHGGQGLFDSLLVFENYPVDEVLTEQGDSALTFHHAVASDVTNYPLGVEVQVGETLSLKLIHQRRHFDAGRVEAMAQQLLRLVQALSGDETRALREIDALPESQRRRLFDQGRGPHRDDDVRTPVHRLIERHAEWRPDTMAVCMGDRRLSHAELNARANRLADYLIEQGVGPESVVGVAMQRCPDVIVSLLAVLKAGGAYVPLDPAYPAERLAFMIDDSGMSLLLTQRAVLSQLPPLALPTVAWDDLGLDGRRADNPRVEVHEHSLAYVIYTSGSTGTPKGVSVAHGPLSMHCRAIAELYAMPPESCELHFMSFAFDGAHERWLTALCVGAGLAMRDEALWTPEQALQALDRHDVRNVAFPPAYLSQIADWAGDSERVPGVELYVFGGEAMPKAAYDKVRHTLCPETLINGYGPTETVVTPLLWKTPASETFDGPYAPIGRPVGERTLYVLDADLQPLPPGATGELYIGGYGMARGYLAQPGLTAERFVADPFAAEGGRLYRTGDLVRWMDDGNIEYRGRADHQVKIRGFRIELGEIEARVRDIDGVAEVAVIARDTGSGRQLVAYLVAAAGHHDAELLDAAHAHLRACLPAYMVPAHLMALPGLPTMVNGKLDRAVLPAPDTAPGRRHVAPASPEARLVAQVWREVLGIDRVGIHDNFFELGGDSLLCLQVVSRLRRLGEAAPDIALRDLMERPTIDGLLGGASAAPGHGLVPLNAECHDTAPLFCVHAVMGTVFDYRPLARRLQGERTVYGLPCRTLADPGHLDTSLEQMARDYCELIRGIQPRGPYYLLGWSLGGTLASMMAARFEAEGQEVAFLGLVDPFVPDPSLRVEMDWRRDFADFVDTVLPGATQEALAAEVPLDEGRCPEPATLEAALEGLVSGRHASGEKSAGLGSRELARMFLAARQLKALSLRLSTLPALRCRPYGWWVAERPLADRERLSQWLTLAGEAPFEVDADHFAIAGDPLFLNQAAPLLMSPRVPRPAHGESALA
ncbi:amino acid adenylation domain-containing protein [Halomonas sp. THAF12]|uniref:amino acid adenylation domain-containing protein n=1 Tax=Halomonas sp. B23F22_10 TaxID=3459515 RepID=UPI00373E6533